MKIIESFKINHLKLKPGLYLSRVDKQNDCEIRTFDLRFTTPNVDEILDTGTMHTIEHIAATYLRNSSISKDVVYFGPMGCRTGFYLVLFGKYSPTDIKNTIIDLCNFIIDFEDEIPGATPAECGNYSDQNLAGSKIAIQKYLEELQTYSRTQYPE